mmetsp:Transcript_7586/g.21599  ORF Transcript_7586/g.21599 Transcript_7586/m.21599 type:complete len:245 (-) Transcript_7586:3188-3922(-)
MVKPLPPFSVASGILGTLWPRFSGVADWMLPGESDQPLATTWAAVFSPAAAAAEALMGGFWERMLVADSPQAAAGCPLLEPGGLEILSSMLPRNTPPRWPMQRPCRSVPLGMSTSNRTSMASSKMPTTQPCEPKGGPSPAPAKATRSPSSNVPPASSMSGSPFVMGGSTSEGLAPSSTTGAGGLEGGGGVAAWMARTAVSGATCVVVLTRGRLAAGRVFSHVQTSCTCCTCASFEISGKTSLAA